MKSENPKSTLIRGAFWTVGTRWAIKLVGFINTVIMARLILPSDYGVVAMATLLVGLIQAFTDIGAETAIMRMKSPSTDDIDSAWTLRLIQSMVVGMLMMGIAPLAALYFNEPRVQKVIWVIAVLMAINGTTNIGLTLAQKKFNFSLFFRVNVYSKIVSVAATLISGYILRDYRALVIGIGSGYLTSVALSYIMHPYRPRWNTKKIKEIWNITKWLMVTSIGTFLLRRSDEILAARIAGTAEYGSYHVGADLGKLPVSELGPAMMRAFLPILSSLQEDTKRVNAAVLKTLSAVNVLTMPIGFGVAAIALPLTTLVLGEKWTNAAPFVAIFAIISTIQFIASPLITLLILNGYTKIQSTAIWIEFALFIVAAYFLFSYFDLIGLAIARLLASLLSTGLMLYFSQKYCFMSIRKMLFSILRPMVGAIIMGAGVYYYIQNIYDLKYIIIPLVIISSAIFYIFWCLITWLIIGKPEGLESTVLDSYKLKFK